MKKIKELTMILTPELKTRMHEWFKAAQTQIDQDRTTPEVEASDFNEHVVTEILELDDRDFEPLTPDEELELVEALQNKSWVHLFNR